MNGRERRAHLRRIGSLGGQRRAARLRSPYPGTFLEFLDAVGKGGPSRSAWRCFWKAADGLPMDDAERELFRLHTGRKRPPTTPAREVWCIAGRRSGKSENAVTRATWRAVSKDWRAVLSAGERGIIPVIAADRDQARNTLAYLKGLVKDPLAAPHVTRVLRDSVEFSTGVTVAVHTASWRTVRGFTFLDAVLEECAFYRSDDSANPDVEILAAIRPALLTVPDARVYGISTPYGRRGVLFDAWRRHWGRDDSDVLVWCADSAGMNPTLDAAAIERAFEDDPAVAGSEYGRDGLVTFRADVEAFIARAAVEALVVLGRLELPRVAGVVYVAFVDPSGGSQDSFTLAVAHADRETRRAVLDCVREIRPPFSPDAVVEEFAAVLRSYGLARVTGDRYAGEWPRERFRARGIVYEPSERTKSDLYREALPLVNAGRVELLDVPRLAAQLVGLERRVGRGTGRDSIDHGPGGHDDLANAAVGALVNALPSGALPPGKTFRVVWAGMPPEPDESDDPWQG